MRLLITLLFLMVSQAPCLGQFTDRVWCFGDSVKMKFTSGGVVMDNPSGVFSVRPAGAICDSLGNLLFYVSTYSTNPILLSSYIGAIFDDSDQIFIGGDSLSIDPRAINGTLILPINKGSFYYYYIFHHKSYQSINNFYYNWSLLSDSNSTSAIVSKNNLLSNMSSADKMAAVKHGNGKDWWLVTHSIQADTFCIYLIDSNGINAPIIQQIGANYNVTAPFQGLNGELVISKFGNHLAAVSNDIIDIFDFDRCTGIISNYRNLMTFPNNSQDQYYWACSFSPSERYFYVSNFGFSGNPGTRTQHTLQFDMQATPIISSRCTLNFAVSDYAAYQHQLGPDGKIYITRGDGGWPTIVTDTGSTFLSVIENPNDPCPSVIFNTFGQSLDGRRCLGSLPNNPNYELGRVEPNGCASGLPSDSPQGEITIYPNPANSYFDILLSGNSTDNSCVVEVIDAVGKAVLNKTFDSDDLIRIPSIKFPDGVYSVRVLISDKQYHSKLIITH